ncbi:hypothetical protein MLD38_037322 [Melastoma candidum]|uniref:Uncharacterized protein n=1 Tax=Melastoma candidum TaxID=119954 RepID=A0ACB9LMQ1_9MYRT|nr:hypothetical protein MLD38_037322 [Melastoma candidum]
MYADQSSSNVTGSVALSGEFHDWKYSRGNYLSGLDMQSVIKTTLTSYFCPLPLDDYGGLYLVLMSGQVRVQDFCHVVCGFHYTFPHIVGDTVPYAWVGYSRAQCRGLSTYPFAWPGYSGRPPPSRDGIMKPTNEDAGEDGMIV